MLPRSRPDPASSLPALCAHGDPACFNAYFPRYLLKCLQDWFEHYGDDLYGELKHIRNALDQVLAARALPPGSVTTPANSTCSWPPIGYCAPNTPLALHPTIPAS